MGINENKTEKVQRKQLNYLLCETDESFDLLYKLSPDKKGYILTGRGDCYDEVVRVPERNEGLPVIAVGESAFARDNGLKEIILPKTIKSIGSKAFYNSENLEKIEMSGVTSVGSASFQGCDSLAQIEDGVSYVNDWAVFFDNNIATPVLRENTIGIGGGAFSRCDKLEEIILPNSVKYICQEAFLGCENAVKLHIGNNVKEIETGAFGGLKSLSDVEIMRNGCVYSSENLILSEDGKKLIAYLSFDKVEHFSIPKTITEIDSYAFCGAEISKGIYVPSSVENIGTSAFKGCGATVFFKDKKPKIGFAESWDTGASAIKYGHNHHLPKGVCECGFTDENKIRKREDKIEKRNNLLVEKELFIFSDRKRFIPLWIVSVSCLFYATVISIFAKPLSSWAFGFLIKEFGLQNFLGEISLGVALFIAIFVAICVAGGHIGESDGDIICILLGVLIGVIAMIIALPIARVAIGLLAYIVFGLITPIGVGLSALGTLITGFILQLGIKFKPTKIKAWCFIAISFVDCTLLSVDSIVLFFK